MTDERDEMIERVSAALRESPAVDPAAKARVLVAVAAERERGTRAVRSPALRHRWIAAATGLAAAVALVAWYELGAPRRDRFASLPAGTAGQYGAAAPNAAPPATLAAGASDDASALRNVQLVFRAPAAHRVSVVGDFTDWDARQAPMMRDSASGLWSISLALRPGRHVYAFLVDDTVWVQDPRAMEAPDADFGRPGSVLLVGVR
jgi:hypothetical protein